MKYHSISARIPVALLTIWMGTGAVMAEAQSAQQSAPAPSLQERKTIVPAPSTAPWEKSNAAAPSGANSSLPDAPSAAAQQPTTTYIGPQGSAAEPSQQNTTQQPSTSPQPLGTAAAESGIARGGAASRPAGMAIAPAKQRQVRSMLIKLGAVAAGGVAVGTIYALSKKTSATVPGTR